MKHFTEIGSRIIRDEAGNVLPLVAMATLVGIAIVGGGVDVSRAYKAQNRMQAACDAAALAGRKAVSTNGFDSAAEDAADRYFATNFDEKSQEVKDVTFEATSGDNGNTVLATATAVQNTALMRVFGFDEFNLDVSCSASMGVGNSDVVMVLDTTGSMGGSRIAALRTSMKNFYDTLDDATGGTNARIRYGFVPYSQTVNVGALLESDWLVDQYNYSSRRPEFDLQVTDVFDHWDDPVFADPETSNQNNTNTSWNVVDYSDPHNKKKDCINALPPDGGWADYGTPETEDSSYQDNGQLIQIVNEIQPQRKAQYQCKKESGDWYVQQRFQTRDRVTTTTGTSDAVYRQEEVQVFDRWIYDSVPIDTSVYKTFQSASALVGGEGSGDPLDRSGAPVSVSSLWDGCIVERATVAASSFSYSSMFGMSPSEALDLNIDMVPDPADPDTQWAPLWPEVSYRRWNNSTHYTTQATFSGTSERDSAVCPAQAQLLSEMDETAFDNYADSLVARGNTYLDIGMLWGARLSSLTGIFSSNVAEEPANGGEVSRHLIFMTDGEMVTRNDFPTAYGIERNEHRVTDNGHSNQDERHLARFSAICQATKAKGIRIWVIAFGTSLANHLSSCASENSAFEADDADALDATFQEIAKQVGELRIIQ